MDFLKGFDIEKAFDIEKVAGSVAALSALDEFPDRAKVAAAEGKVAVTAAGANKARTTYVAWNDLDFEGHKQEWEKLCLTLEKLQGRDSSNDSKDRWQERAKSAEYELLKLCNTLLPLPDPTHILSTAAALSTKIVEVEAQNRELQAAAEAAAADNREVTALVEQHRTLEAQYKELQAVLSQREQELTEAQQGAGETQAARQEVATLQADLTKTQGQLRALREEHEVLQAQLFEVSSKHEQAEGNRQRELETALEDLEALSHRCAELELERDKLAARLTAAAAAVPAASSADGSQTVQEEQQGSAQEPLAGFPSPAGSRPSGDGFWERQLRIRTEQLEQLESRLQAAEREALDVQNRHETQLQAAANQLAAAQLNISKLQAELSSRPAASEHSELKARAEALQQLVDVQIESEAWNADVAKQHLGTLGSNAASTHALLQERNRALSTELASCRRHLSERATEVSALQQELAQLRDQLGHQSDLVQRLESDLAAVKGLPRGDSAKPMLPAPGLTVQVHNLRADATLGGDATAMQGMDAELLQPSTPPAGGGGTGAGGDGLLDILVQQRDRFRQRVGQLEEEKGTLAQELADCRRQVDALRSDNVALYEKVRYLEQYSQRALAQSGGQGGRTRHTVVKVDADGVALPEPQSDRRAHRYQCGPLSLEFGNQAATASSTAASGGAAVPGGGGVRARGGGGRGRLGAGLCFPEDPEEEGQGPEARYTKAYEARVNPFTEFQRNEVETRVRGLQLHDRAVLAGGKLLVGSKFGRLFVAIYALLLHIFVMVLLYYAMAPKQRIVEFVDAATLEQQKAAAVKGAARRLLQAVTESLHGRLRGPA